MLALILLPCANWLSNAVFGVARPPPPKHFSMTIQEKAFCLLHDKWPAATFPILTHFYIVPPLKRRWVTRWKKKQEKSLEHERVRVECEWCVQGRWEWGSLWACMRVSSWGVFFWLHMKRACRHAQIFNLLVGGGGVRAMSATVGGWMGGGGWSAGRGGWKQPGAKWWQQLLKVTG